MSELNDTDKMKAARNEGYGEFTLTNPQTGNSKTFQLKNLSYDAYVEFCSLARPILITLGNGLDMGNKGGEFSLEFNPLNLDFEKLIEIAGKELPRMAWLCCRQSDPKIKLEEVKELGYRPQNLLLVVLQQIKHNDLVKEFADFFPQLVAALTELMPAATAAAAPIPTESTTPTE